MSLTYVNKDSRYAELDQQTHADFKFLFRVMFIDLSIRLFSTHC